MMDDFWKNLVLPELEEDIKSIIDISWENDIKVYQGDKVCGSLPLYDWIKNLSQEDKILFFHNIDELIKKEEFQKGVINIKKEAVEREIKELEKCSSENEMLNQHIIGLRKKYLNVLDWDWFVQNDCKSLVSFVNIDDWRYVLFGLLAEWYKEEKYGRFEECSDDCGLQDYLDKKEIKLRLADQYGLLTLADDWDLIDDVNVNPPLVEIPGTYILTKNIPYSVIPILRKLRKQNPSMQLSIRPNYHIFGDGFRKMGFIPEAIEQGKFFTGKISQIRPLSSFYNINNYENRLIIKNDNKNVYFEELRDDIIYDKDSIVTQLLHVEYKSENGIDYITHMDHEFIFYTQSQFGQKKINLNTRGNERKRYKTFKIDKSKIEAVFTSDNNFIADILKCYFKNHDLLQEFFNDYAAC